ncbi:TAP domain protein, partial [Streptomyces coelicoflavus ZG0656]
MILRTLALVAFAAGLTSLAPPAKAAAPVFTEKACPAEWPTEVRQVRCGTLTVDEARDGTVSDRRIDLALVIIKAAAPYKVASGQALPTV